LIHPWLSASSDYWNMDEVKDWGRCDYWNMGRVKE
jgi:hypothetical protein